ncbi:GTP-binding protein [Salicibibacter cibarius]|uniref:GTP-binding protein n=1 Tax=Salicibibacter cibarius TaxID=2743000 RepID=A0A7T7CAB3_9BACI|nr:GTP-binding protein [Salicibibacter cibarius]QQK74714.1 GTP-binding protein [Salicibibacter cibarius]
MDARVPVIVINGFLGSGKTTLLKSLIKETKEKGLKASVLINEFGKNDTDGQIVSPEINSKDIETIVDGCICCTKKSEVVYSLEKLLRKSPDVIFVESTGVANPEEIVDAFSNREIISKLFLSKMVTMIDAQQLLEQNILLDKKLQNTVETQMIAADLLIVNKIDLIDKTSKPEIITDIRENNERGKIIFTTYSTFDYKYIFESVTNKTKSLTSLFDRDSQHGNLSYTSLATITLPAPNNLNEEKFKSFLLSLHPNLLRAKGYVGLQDKNGLFLLQHVKNNTVFQKVEYHKETYLTFIGIDLDAKQIYEGINSLQNQNS